MAQAWTDLPLDRPVHLEGPSATTLTLATEVLGAGSPAVVTFTAGVQDRPAPIIDALLTSLDQMARELFPAWLPDARPLEGLAGAGAAAVRLMALDTAQREGYYGPFLVDLAARALSGSPTLSSRLSAPVRAAGLARTIASSFARQRAALLVIVPEGLSAEAEQALVGASRFLTDSGFGLWLTGAPLLWDDSVESIPFGLPVPDVLIDPSVSLDAAPDPVTYPPLAGRPHPASHTEQMLEAALRCTDWATGREWNQLHQVHPLTSPIRVDLLWRHERCVVEIDGEEHRQLERFAADRQRDVCLQLAGFAVLRFTNNQVIRHCDLVLSQIRQFLDGRRAGRQERAVHV